MTADAVALELHESLEHHCKFAQAEAQWFREMILEVIIMWSWLSATQLQYEELRLLQHSSWAK